ncbi:TIR domain-containing protein [Micromonospora sp. PLK6-60]|uniref:TIR domain-containing protein n=1 Tax=Micromonospora sp. PLK6-60 TaxID=2873383 RepID=UPI001CA6DDEF|nr:TIR domain-containing protein [Micromonospora sp. PLK6-60]MBY8874213.1 TIR domain-containing protein [Micromonospora sp. PLK6-60]
MRAAPRYDAFISYSHDQDRVIARALHSALHSFARPWYRVRALRIFRDEHDLGASPHLWKDIEAALATSSWFVLMASRRAAKSHWVEQEVRWWLEHRARDRILIALTDGDLVWPSRAVDFDWSVTDCLPDILRGRFTDGEPRWIDLRGLRDVAHPSDQAADAPSWRRRLRRPRPEELRLGDLVIEFAAPLHGRSKADMHRESRRRRLQFRATVAATLAVLLATTTVAFLQRNAAVDQARIATARQLAANSLALQATRLDLAQLLAVEAYRMNPDRQTRAALFQSVTTSPHLVRYLHADDELTTTVGSRDGRVAVAGTRGGRVYAWDVGTGRRVELPRLGRLVTGVSVNADGQVVAATDGTTAYVWTPGGGRTSLASPAPEALPSGVSGRVAVSPSGRYVTVGLERDYTTFLTTHDRSTGRRTSARAELPAGSLAMPTESELVIVDGGGRWDRRAVPGLTRRTHSDFALNGARGGPTAVSGNGAWLTYTTGAPVLNLWRTDRPADQNRPDLRGLSHGSLPQAIAISDSGTRLAVVDGGTVYVSATDRGDDLVTSQLALPGNSTTVAAGLRFFGADERLLMITGSDLVVWNLQQITRAGRSTPVPVEPGCSACPPPQVDIRPDGGAVAVLDADGSHVAVRPLEPGALDTTLTAPSVTYTAVGWAADGRSLFLNTNTAGIQVHAAAPGLPRVRQLSGPDIGAQPLGLTPDRRGLLYVAEDQPGRFWVRNVATGEIDWPPTAADTVEGARAPYSGQVVTTFLTDGRYRAQVIDVGSGTTRVMDTRDVDQVASSTEHVVVTRTDGTVEVWDAAGRQRLRSLHQDSSFRQPADSTDPATTAGYLAQQRSDRNIVVTDLDAGEEVASLTLPERYRQRLVTLTFTPDGRDLLAVAEGGVSEPEDGLLVRWSLSPDAWTAAACAAVGRDLSADEWRRFAATDPPDDLSCRR